MNWATLLKTKTARLGLAVVVVGIARTAFPDLLPWDEILTVLLGGMGITMRDAVAKSGPDCGDQGRK